MIDRAASPSRLCPGAALRQAAVGSHENCRKENNK
jgi:hypothetical protein